MPINRPWHAADHPYADMTRDRFVPDFKDYGSGSLKPDDHPRRDHLYDYAQPSVQMANEDAASGTLHRLRQQEDSPQSDHQAQEDTLQAVRGEVQHLPSAAAQEAANRELQELYASDECAVEEVYSVPVEIRDRF